MPSTESRFIVSLDFELMWGVRDKRTLASYGTNIQGVRQVIPALLDQLEQYGVRATFATVGFLFAESKEELLRYCPLELPKYGQERYSPYQKQYLASVGSSEKEDIHHFAWSLLKQIRQFPNQEIASHTFSHYYCLEGASLDSFEADLYSAKQIAEVKGITLRSIVFPRNQYSPEHISICRKLGFIAYRGNGTTKLYQPRSNEELNKRIRLQKLADTYVNLTGHHTFTPIIEHGLVNVPASRFLRPFSSRLKWLENLRLERIKRSMTYAAEKGECYHLWWHPHNFGVNLQENMHILVDILKHYQQLHRQYGMESKTMSGIAADILTTHAV